MYNIKRKRKWYKGEGNDMKRNAVAAEKYATGTQARKKKIKSHVDTSVQKSNSIHNYQLNQHPIRKKKFGLLNKTTALSL